MPLPRKLIHYFGDAWLGRLGQGIHDSSVPEIVAEARNQQPEPRDIKLVQDSLRHIVIYIRQELPPEKLVHTVNEVYYKQPKGRPSFRKVPPGSLEEGKSILPIGKGVRRYGIRLAPDELDWAVIAALQYTGKCTNPAARKVGERFIYALSNGQVSRSDCKKMFIEWAQCLRPENRPVLGRLWNGVKNPLDL